MRIAAVADLHVDRHSSGRFDETFRTVSGEADVLVICGDLTDYGLPDEAAILAGSLRSNVRIPVLSVLGNHDYESDRVAEVAGILEDAGVRILDGDGCEAGGVGFAGVPGFGGGFGARMLNAWGEPLIKKFVQEAVDQALRLEKAIAHLNTEKKVVLLHYAPVRDTVAGEPEEIYPFLGSTRLEGPANRHGVNAIFHGHAHAGTLTGRTSAGIPVHNVSLPVLQRSQPGRPYYLLEL